MCGICFIVFYRRKQSSYIQWQKDVAEDVSPKLKRRGPNHFQAIKSSHDAFELQFVSSVLHLRGSSPVPQPISDTAGNTLMWNGEIFDEPVVDESESDSKILSDRLFNCKKASEVLEIIGRIKGPFAFIFYQNNGLIWFGRDIFGRRSLLWNAENSSFHICSVAYGNSDWKEVPTAGIFCLDLNQTTPSNSFTILLHPWSSGPSGSSLQASESIQSLNIITNIRTDLFITSSISQPLNTTLPSCETQTSAMEISEGYENLFLELAKSQVFQGKIEELEYVLSTSVQRRVQNQLHVCKDCYSTRVGDIASCEHASVGVLFSGGLDSIVIACLANRHIPENEPVDLINVAFASNASLKQNTNHSILFNTPDRLTGRNGVLALKSVCPNRKWNFVEVNISEETLISKRRDTISELLQPSCTVLDDSIGCALWFAARGEGILVTVDGDSEYKSPARVLLVGMGADEQFGGYSRHRAKFSSSGWSGLIEELSLELNRIGSRNLGRDDRIIADNGVESRYPFLDEDVVTFLNGVPVWLKTDLRYPRGIGEKLLLRLLAFKLGLCEAALLPKRAIQFGSRIAKIENSKEKGSDVCHRLKKITL